MSDASDSIDKGADRETRPPKPCGERLGHGSWCYLDDGHDEEHRGAAPLHLALERKPVIWSRHRGLHCTDPDCCLPIGHAGEHFVPGVSKPKLQKDRKGAP